VVPATINTALLLFGKPLVLTKLAQHPSLPCALLRIFSHLNPFSELLSLFPSLSASFTIPLSLSLSLLTNAGRQMAESKNAQMEEKLFKFPLLVWIRRCLNLSATLSQPLYCVALPLCMCLSLSVCVCLSVCVLASLVLADSTNKLALSIIKQQLIGVSLSAYVVLSSSSSLV
jgi:hypothetical protein